MSANPPRRDHATRFQKGRSGNPGGRPKGLKTFSVKRIIAEALADGATEEDAIKRVQENLRQRKTVLSALEFAARVNKEIGLGSGEAPAGVTIIFESNIRPRAPRPTTKSA